jgi:integrase
MPSGTRSFIFQYRTRGGVQGKQTIGHYPAMTVEAARRVARALRTEVDAGGNPSESRRVERKVPTVAHLIDFYTGEYARTRGLKPDTAKSMRSLMDRFVRPVLGSRKAVDVKTVDIRKAHASAREGAGRYAANKLKAGLNRMFVLARQNGWCAENPCTGVERYPEDKRQSYLSDVEVLRLLAACDTYADQNPANAIRLLLFTGARLREVLGAMWSQFELEKGLWEKPSHHTKTKMRHLVHLADPVVELLRRMRQEGFGCEHLFPGRIAGKCRADLKKPWEHITKTAGLSGFCIHDLRRTHASFMLSSGADLTTVGKALGHTQASTTLRYAFLLTDVQKEAANRTVQKMGLLRVVG